MIFIFKLVVLYKSTFYENDKGHCRNELMLIN